MQINIDRFGTSKVDQFSYLYPEKNIFVMVNNNISDLLWKRIQFEYFIRSIRYFWINDLEKSFIIR